MHPPYTVMSFGEKVSKERAEYRKGSPYARCGLCSHRSGARCDIVFGQIGQYQVCKYFQAKDGSRVEPADAADEDGE